RGDSLTLCELFMQPPSVPPPHMYLSCFTNSYGRFGAGACIAGIRAAGLTHVELAIKTQGVPSIFGEQPILTDRSTAADVAGVQALLEEHAASLSRCNITSGIPLEEPVVEITLRKLDLAQQLGAGDRKSTRLNSSHVKI